MKWTSKEILLLKSKYGSNTWSQLLKLFPDRSKLSIKNKAIEIGLNRRRFTIKGGQYFTYYYCIIHGKIYKEEIKLKGRKAYCPRIGCNRLLRTLPKKSKLKEKYRRNKI